MPASPSKVALMQTRAELAMFDATGDGVLIGGKPNTEFAATRRPSCEPERDAPDTSAIDPPRPPTLAPALMLMLPPG